MASQTPAPPKVATSIVAKPTNSRFARRHPNAYLGVHGLVGLAIAAACTWAFFAIADEVPERGMMVRVDLAVTNWLQTHGTEKGESIFSAVSLLGGPVLAALLVITAVVLLVRRDWRHLAVLAVTCGGGALLNVVLKFVGWSRRQRRDVARSVAALNRDSFVLARPLPPTGRTVSPHDDPHSRDIA